MSTDWGSVMFTDRKKFAFRYPGTKHKSKRWIRKSKGGRKGNKCFKPTNPRRVNLCMGITKWGVRKVHKVAGSSGMKSGFCTKKGQPSRNITSAEYAQVLKKTLLPEGSRIFTGKGKAFWKLQQDNDPTHKKPAATQLAAWNEKHPGRTVDLLLNWPPNSPDLSPIENVWAIVQKQVDATGCKNFKEFEACVVQRLKNLDPNSIENLLGSMAERIRLCIEANEDKIKY